MKQPRLTRRQFFKVSAFGAGALVLPALGLASVAAAPSQAALAAAQQPQGPAIPQPTFNPIASNTTFGALTDISMGWDGTLWGIDGEGAPHVYDSINNLWAQHGEGIDAVAQLGNSLYLFNGDSVVTSNNALPITVGPLVTIASQWPSLPDSFKIGVMGAANFNAKGLILFNGGRFISTDGSIPLTALTSLTNWPQSPAWNDGVIDAVYCTNVGQPIVLIRDNQFIGIDPVAKTVTSQPAPLNTLTQLNVLPADWVSSGFDTGTVFGNLDQLAFKGTALSFGYNFAPPGSADQHYIPTYFPGWPTSWHPALRHAPNGRDGNLYSVAMPAASAQNPMGYILQHDGETWIQQPDTADHVGVGQDNTVMIASAGKLWKDVSGGNGNFQPVSSANNLIQVSLGNANTVFARDASNNVYRFDPGSGGLTQNTDVGTVLHIATTNDGSLWHAKPNDSNMHRQLVGSGQAPEAIPVKQGLTASVSKVAGTGFGVAHCLAADSQGNMQAYRYDSPYVFKTATPYNVYTPNGTPAVIEQGAGTGLLFMIDNVLVSTDPQNPVTKAQIVALDAHTGVEVARTPRLLDPLDYRQPVFDPFLNLVYVGAAANTSPGTDGNAGPGQLLALDAKTLAVKWSFTTAASIDARPSLDGTRLCVGDRTGKLYMFDTTAALANPTNVQPTWTANAATNTAQTHRIAPPTFVPLAAQGSKSDLIYTVVWDCNFANGTWNFSGTWLSYWVADGAPNDSAQPLFRSFALLTDPDQLLVAPARGTLNIGSDAAPSYSPALYYYCFDAVVAVGAGPTTKTFLLPAGDYIRTGFTYDDGRTSAPPLTSTGQSPNDAWLWFGTNNGLLYCLDTNLSPVNYTPFSTANAAQPFPNIFTTPVIYNDGQGNTTVFFNAFEPGAINEPGNLLGFDPDNGNLASVPTGATRIVALSQSVTNGVIYAGGWVSGGDTGQGEYPQVFAIRVNDLVQAERDFIIESQLMQDPQDPGGTGGSTVTAPDGNVIPNSVSRYQTHLTVVDDKKHPRANEPVKIWADVDGTIITVDGTPYTIGPADSAYAAMQTGVDGSLVIVSEAKDVNASALRAWAAFMDPYERIVVYPDHEWHGRVTQSNADDTVADPGKPNLNKAYKYDGTTLFTDSDRQQGQPGNVASAVGQMNTGVNPGGNSPATVAGALKTLHGSNPIAPYVAYTTLGGMHYGPNNARAKRTATVATPFGFVLNKPQGGAHTYTPLSHTDARSAIDALPYPLWDPNNPNGTPTASATADTPVVFVVRRSDNVFTDFWNWLVGAFNAAADAIENVIVSVANDIMVGINFIINGVKQAFKAIIKVIEDVVNAIGSFFLQLLKAIEDLIAALSILFHFGEIMWTHRWLASMLAYQKEQLKTILVANAKSPIDNFLTTSEDTINSYIDKVKAQINGQQSFNTMQGAGATSHSAMTAGPGQAGNTNSGSSQAVQGGWGVQKMKSGFSSQTGSPSLAFTTAKAVTPEAASDDPVTDFVTGFLNSLKTNTGLSNALSDAKNDISTLFTANSPTAFFTGLLTTLLDILKLMLDSALALSQAIVDGVFNALDDIIDAIWDAIAQPLDFPVISWLYKLLFNEDLTLLNLATLVVAIPVTIIYRVVSGEYPQDSHNATPYSPWQTNASAMQAGSPQGALAGIAPDWAQKFIGTASGIFNLVYYLINALNDFLYPLIKSGVAKGFGPVLGWLGNLAVGLDLVNAALSYPGFTTDLDKISLGTWFAYGLDCVLALFAVNGLSTFDWDEADSAALGAANAFGYTVMLIGVISDFAVNGGRDVNSDLNFASSLIGTLPNIINPVKFIDPELALLDSGVDLFAGFATCALGIAATWHSQPTLLPPLHRLHIPWVASDPTNARPIPLAAAMP